MTCDARALGHAQRSCFFVGVLPVCSHLSDPYINDCSYDGAGRGLTALYGPLQPSVSPVTANLLQFEQTLFGTGASLNTVGYV